MPYFTNNEGTNLFFKDWGTGRPVVFLHAWAMSSQIWDYNMLYFNDRNMRCIAYDKRGHGKSDDPGKYSFDGFADDLELLMEKLDLQDVILVAHCMGTGELVRYLTRYGHKGRVSKAVLVAPFDDLIKTETNPDGLDIAIPNASIAQMRIDFPKWMDDGADGYYLPRTLKTTTGMINWTIDMMLQTSLKAAVDCCRMVFSTNFTEELKAINIPTLVIHGDKDESIPFAVGRNVSKLIPGARFIPYEGAPHGVITTHLERINNDIYSFIME